MDKKTLVGILCVLCTGCFFGSMELTIGMLDDAMPPMQINFERFFVGGLVLLVFTVAALKKKGITLKDIPAKDWRYFCILGFINVVISMSCFQIAISLELPAIVAIFMSTTPVFTTILATPIAHEEVHLKNIISVAFGLGATAVMLFPNLGEGNPAGIILALCAAITFALYGVLNKKPIKQYGGLACTCFASIIGSIELGLLLMVGHIPTVSAWLNGAGLGVLANVPFFTGHTLENLSILIYVYVGVTALGYVSWFKAIDNIGAQGASMVFFVKPILACFLAWLIIAEPITIWMKIGVAMLLCGSLSAFLPTKKNA